MKNTFLDLVYVVSGTKRRDEQILNALKHFADKYDIHNRHFIGAYELHLFTGIKIRVVRRALNSLERRGLVKSVPRYLNGVRLNSAGYTIV